MEDDLAIESRLARFSRLITSGEYTDGSSEYTRDIEDGVRLLQQKMNELITNKHYLYILGNGGSAAVASHAVVDFLNVGGVRAMTLHEPSLVTCMANDFGYENAYANTLVKLLNPGDMVVAISSSGQSPNIINAATQALELGCALITLSGFKRDNPLRQMGSQNFWLNASDYGMVEIGHQFILHNVADRLKAKGMRLNGD